MAVTIILEQGAPILLFPVFAIRKWNYIQSHFSLRILLTYFLLKMCLCVSFLFLPEQITTNLVAFFFPFIFISWRLITLQYCTGFCHTLT